MKTTLNTIAFLLVLTAPLGAAASPQETARQYCSVDQGYNIGDKEYRNCERTFLSGHCNGQGNAPGSQAHTECMKAVLG